MSVILGEAKNLSVLLAVALLFLVAGAFAQKKPPAKPIDLNTASIEQLEQFPGVGPVTGKSIYDFRKKSGPFHRPEDLLSIRGISEKRYQAIAPYIVVSQLKPAAPPKPGATAPARPTAAPKSTPPPSATAKPAATPPATATPK